MAVFQLNRLFRRQVLQEASDNKEDLTDGHSLVSKYFCNRTFQTEFGGVSIDNSAMRVESSSVAYFNPDGNRTVTYTPATLL